MFDPDNKIPGGVDPAEAARLAAMSRQRAEEGRERVQGAAPCDECAGVGFSRDEILGCLKNNEIGDARIVTAIGRGRFVFDHSDSKAYRWGGNWELDRIHEIAGLVGEAVAVYAGEAKRQGFSLVEALGSGDKEAAGRGKAIRDALEKRISLLQSKQRLESVLKLATWGLGSLGIGGLEWDSRPDLLAVANGTLELETGRFRPSRREDYLRTVAPTEWHGQDAPRARWERFVLEIFGDDPELAGYFRRLVGYGLSGAVTEHILPVLWGTGRNGKGVAIETIGRVLGDLACPVQSEILLASSFVKAGGGPSSEILNLRGRRICWASETGEGQRLNAAKIKSLTGGDSLCGRAPYGKHEISFSPSHLLVLVTNFRPRADAGDRALWARIHLVPFGVAFVDNPEGPNEKPRDPHLSEKLAEEAPGILAWMLQGHLEWRERGLDPPAVVLAATSEYRADEDLIGQFIEERCWVQSLDQVKASNLYGAYKAWCEDMGHRPVSGNKFGRRLRERGFDAFKEGTIHYIGIRLKNDE